MEVTLSASFIMPIMAQIRGGALKTQQSTIPALAPTNPAFFEQSP
jgi:hypothetical protein